MMASRKTPGDSLTLTNGIDVRGTYSAANLSVHDASLGEVVSFAN
jgi:hypothetical protein